MGILTKVVGCMAVAGAIAGPGYSIYCDFLSGGEIGKFGMSQLVRDWSAPNGQNLTFGPAGAFKPFIVELNPEMNPVGFVWSGHVEGKKYVQYRAHLYLGEQSVMDKSVGISGDKEGGSESASIGTVRVPSTGQYHFVLEPSRERDRYGASNLTIEVRRNVVVKNKRIVGPGIAVLVIFFILYLILKNRERKALDELSEDAESKNK
jgi:hypothetical protein